MTEPFKIDPRVEELLKSGSIAKEIAQKISKRINILVKQLRKKYPDHDGAICRHLEGAAQTIHAENEAAKRKTRDALYEAVRKEDK